MNEKMLTKAMRKAVQLGVFPKVTDEETYLRNWYVMEEILKAALSAQQGAAPDAEAGELANLENKAN